MRRVRYDLVLNICLANYCMGVEYCYKCKFLDDNEHHVCNITRWALDGAKEVFDEKKPENIVKQVKNEIKKDFPQYEYNVIIDTDFSE